MSDKPILGLPTIGEAIRAAREDRGMSTRELARASGVLFPTLLALEEARPNPTFEQLIQITEALDTSIAVLVCDAEDRMHAKPPRFKFRRSATDLEARLTLTLRGKLLPFLASRLFRRGADDDK
jgi:transcriptional regulator with XRE-family HTH domain